MAGKTATTIVSTKGQVILPKPIRERRHWPAGTRLTVEDIGDGVILKPAPFFPPSTLESVFGSLSYQGRPKSVAEMDEAIAAEAKRRAGH
jgi:AbrB family looped-hinge helix DNA binding protein